MDEVTLLTRLGSLVGVRHILISYMLLFLSLVNCTLGGQNNAVDSSGNYRSSQIADNVGAVFQEERRADMSFNWHTILTKKWYQFKVSTKSLLNSIFNIPYNNIRSEKCFWCLTSVPSYWTMMNLLESNTKVRNCFWDTEPRKPGGQVELSIEYSFFL